MPIPRIIKGLQRVLGYINWFRSFLKHLSTRIAGLTEKLRKKRSFYWSENDTKVLKEIFNDIKSETLLIYPDTSEVFTLETNAYETGMGSVLKQDDRVIGLFSRKFTDPQQRYTVKEKELLSIVISLEKF